MHVFVVLQVESEAKAASERDFLEMSTASKTRVLYLEQWKAGASARLVRLQQRLDVSVLEQVRLAAEAQNRASISYTRGKWMIPLNSNEPLNGLFCSRG